MSTLENAAKLAMKFPKPMGQRLLVKPKTSIDKIGSIFIPEAAQEKNCEGKIVEIGLGKLREDNTRQPFSVEVGWRILFGKYGGTEIEVDGVKFMIIHEDDILSILES